MEINLHVRKSILAGITKITISSCRDNEESSQTELDAIVALVDIIQKNASTSRLPPGEVVNLYNTYATKHGWVKVNKQTAVLRAKISTAIKDLPSMSDWETVMKGLEGDPWFSGSDSSYKTSIMTLFYVQRYMQFYDAQVSRDNNVTKIDPNVAYFKSILESIPSEITPFPHLSGGAQ